MFQLAVIGNPIEHSLSPQIHARFADSLGLAVNYQKLLAPLDQFESTARQFLANAQGANVTVPFKQQAFDLCDQLTPEAQLAGAVNTLWQQNGLLLGDNTDGKGLIRALDQAGFTLRFKRVVLFGAGGAARGALGPLLAEAPSELCLVNRTQAKAEALSEDFAVLKGPAHLHACSLADLSGEFDLVINASSSSLSGAPLELPASFTAKQAMDMMYSKTTGQTAFTLQMQTLGAQTSDGLLMLINQAALSFERWCGKAPKLGQIDFSFLRGDH